MNNHISRRLFIQKVGMMSFLCMSPDILNGLDCFASVLSEQSTSVKLRTPTCFIGVGTFGQVLKTMLYKYNPSNCKPHYPGDLDRIAFLEPLRIDFYSRLYKDHLIFLAGSIMDEKFWEIRDFIISKKPKYIISTVLPEYGYTVDESILSENECFITLPVGDETRLTLCNITEPDDDETFLTACNIINDIYTWINGHSDHLGKISHFLPNGEGFGFSMESSTDKSVPELRHLFDQHLTVFNKCKKLHILVFEDPETDFEDLMNFFKIAQKKVGKKTQINWSVLSHWDLNPKFRATILAG